VSADEPHRIQEDATASEELSKETLDRLRALGYADYSEEEADPNELGVRTWDSTRSYPGYNLFTVRPLHRADLVNAGGKLVHSWEGRRAEQWARSVLLPDGDLLVVGPRKFIMRLSWDGEVRWRHEFPAHHEVAATPDGRFIVLMDQKRLVAEIDAELPLRDNLIRVISADGDIVEDLSLVDALSSRKDIFELESIASQSPAMDILHSNSLHWIDRPDLVGQHEIYEPANVLVSVRNQDSIVVVNFATRRLIWAWGRGEIMGPHDAGLLENGNILLFDNGLGRGWSRVIELDPRTEKIVWDYRAPDLEKFYTRSHGAAQRLPNGNTLITESTRGRAFEVTPRGEIVWKYYSPYLNKKGRRATITRLYRYESGFVESILGTR